MCANTTKCGKIITCNDIKCKGISRQNKVTELKIKQWWGWFGFGDGIKSVNCKMIIKSGRNKKKKIGQKWYLFNPILSYVSLKNIVL